MALSYPDLLDWKDQTQVFASVAGYQDVGFTLTARDQAAERFSAARFQQTSFAHSGSSPA